MAIIVTKPFTLNSANGEKREFNVGDQITGKLADHWYVKAHTEEVEVKKETAAEKKAREAEESAAKEAAEKAAADAAAAEAEEKAKAEEAAKAANNPQG